MTIGQLRNRALRSPFHGARFVGEITGLIERCHAVVPLLGGRVISHITAALLWGMPLPARAEFDPLHVTSAAPRRATKLAGCAGHSSRLHDDDTTWLNGIPVTTAERTWCDLAALLDLGDLVAAGDSLLSWVAPKTSIENLRAAVGRHPAQAGRSRLRQALELLSDRSQSRPESLIRVAITLSSLPDVVPNHPLRLARSGRDVRLDLAFPRYKVGLEYQGDHHRVDRDQWRRDVGRGNDVADEGWSILYFTGDDLNDIAGLLARVGRRLRDRGWSGP